MPSNNKYTKSFLSSSDAYYNLHRTTELLMETPFYKKTLAENAELKDKVRYLQYTVDYLEMKNKALRKKMKNKPVLRRQSEKQDDVVFIEVKKEPVEVFTVEDDVSEPIKYEIVEQEEEVEEDEQEEEQEEEEEQEVEQEEEEQEDEEQEDEEQEEVEQEDEQEEEQAEEEQEEEQAEEEQEEEQAEEEQAEDEEQEEEEQAEEEQAEEEQAEEEQAEEEQAEEEESGDDVYEIEIKKNTYYVSNEIDSFIYKADENGEISLEVGKFIDGKATFYKK
jgi:hypothetical protein